jgi:hypothetical protein
VPTRVDDHPVTAGEDVYLTVLIGEGQSGVSTVFLDESKRAARTEVRRLLLGTGTELRGHVLVVSTTVVDIQQAHDRTSVTVVLGNGHERRYAQQADATPSGVVNYLNVITFV